MLKKGRKNRPVSSFFEFPPDHLDEVALVAGLGLSDQEMAAVFGISVGKLGAWRTRYRDFDEAISKGRLRIDGKVVAALYKRAVGYEHSREVRKVVDGEEGVVETVTQETVHVPPDIAAIRFWLTNRSPNWKEKKEVDVTLKLELVDRITRAEARLLAVDAEEKNSSEAGATSTPAIALQAEAMLPEVIDPEDSVSVSVYDGLSLNT